MTDSIGHRGMRMESRYDRTAPPSCLRMISARTSSPNIGHPFSWAYFKHSRWPPLAASWEACFLVPWAPVLVGVLQTLQVATKRPLLHTFSHPMGTRSRGRISNTPGGHTRPLLHTFLSHGHPFSWAYLKHSRSPPAAALDTFPYPMGTRSRGRISNTPGGHPQPLATHVSSSHGHPFSCKYFKHSRWTTFEPRIDTRSLVPWTPVLVCSTSNTPGGHLQPLLHTFPHPMHTRSRASISNTQVGHLSRCSTRVLVPWAPVLVQVFQTLQVTTSSRHTRSTWAPASVLILHPMGTLSRASTSYTPGAATFNRWVKCKHIPWGAPWASRVGSNTGSLGRASNASNRLRQRRGTSTLFAGEKPSSDWDLFARDLQAGPHRRRCYFD